jgi:diguanylate cyclase (GGDEF)-like protein
VSRHDSQKTRITKLIDEDPKDSRPKNPGDACIVVIYGPEIGRRVALGTSAFEIGRSSKTELFIDQESISRHHARITFDGAGFLITDLGSTNGTFVNDAPVSARREAKLQDGDQIQIGRSILKFMTGENIEVHYHEEIYRLMTIDGLTQIYNRRYFDEALEREFNRAKRYARDLSLIALDIDHFKRINDTWGHLAGDNLLRQLVAVLRPKLRREDIFARTGGEEFAVLLPEISLEGALGVAEKLRQFAESAPLRYEQTAIPCTVSLGVSAVIAADVSGAALYKRGDEMLYAAKEGGRNRVAG